jgi:hypothetical protein
VVDAARRLAFDWVARCVPDRLDYPAGGADQDPLSRLGLDEHRGVDPNNVLAGLGDELDLDVDAAHDLLPGTSHDLLADRPASGGEVPIAN